MTDLLKNFNQQLTCIYNKIYDILKVHLPNADIVFLSAEFTRAINNKSIEIAKQKNYKLSWSNHAFLQIVQTQLFEFLMALNPDSTLKSNYLIDILKSREWTRADIEQLVNMPIHKYAPEGTNKLYELIERQKKNTIEMRFSSMYTCPKGHCQSKKIKIFEQQIRASDEPTTITGLCADCQHRWQIQ